MTTRERWLYAWKPASWPKTLVPFLLGQTAGAAVADRLAIWAVAAGLLFTAADTVFIVLLNDWGDRDVDALKRRLFPDGCSPKTIPDGILGADAVLRGGLVAGGIALTVAAMGEAWGGRPGLTWAGAGALGIFLAYTFSPLRLNYRGGGEILEAVGIGVALPGINAYLQAGSVADGIGVPDAAVGVLAGYLPFSLASAVASGLSDEESDRRGGKRTFATTFGNPAARRLIDGLVVAGVAGWVVVGAGHALGPDATTRGLGIGCLAAAVVAIAHLPAIWRLSPLAVTNAFGPQGRYKGALHRAAWRSGVLLAMVLGWMALVPG